MSNNVIVTGNIRRPKWGHLKELRKDLKLCEPALNHRDVNVTSLGKHLEVCSSINYNIREALG